MDKPLKIVTLDFFFGKLNLMRDRWIGKIGNFFGTCKLTPWIRSDEYMSEE